MNMLHLLSLVRVMTDKKKTANAGFKTSPSLSGAEAPAFRHGEERRSLLSCWLSG
ncbi:hypothetical protein [Alicyclobacillus acidocaldarius]|uniref:hypothetical protein n=1 Tax=Alicyclobacillus acidocaldarius TaxID=405212 RepID=UPI001C54C2AF|nr:hypothetical protein [Alicyclobacillus acidocaldarius]